MNYTSQVLILVLISFAAGFIDAVAGGGGLIQVPGLMVILPHASIPSLLGTNKASSIWGTLAASVKYIRSVELKKSLVLLACGVAFCFSILGARLVALISKEVIKPIIIVALIGVLAFTLTKKNFGIHEREEVQGTRLVVLATGIAAVMGFYDGFIGPGTGGFLIFLLVFLLQFTLLKASALAKVINLCTNLAALIYFAIGGNVLFPFAVPMAVANFCGGYLGSHLAINRGNVFVRKAFIGMTTLLLLRLLWDLV